MHVWACEISPPTPIEPEKLVVGSGGTCTEEGLLSTS
jgi:hypothetical protein